MEMMPVNSTPPSSAIYYKTLVRRWVPPPMISYWYTLLGDWPIVESKTVTQMDVTRNATSLFQKKKKKKKKKPSRTGAGGGSKRRSDYNIKMGNAL
jgi:hypothetical protein